MTVSLACLEGDHDRCTGVVIVNNAPFPCECATCGHPEQEAARAC